MEGLRVERGAYEKFMRRVFAKPMFEPSYAKVQKADSQHNGGTGSLANTQTTNNTTWSSLQDPTTGLRYFIPGYDAPGDPCHPIHPGSG